MPHPRARLRATALQPRRGRAARLGILALVAAAICLTGCTSGSPTAPALSGTAAPTGAPPGGTGSAAPTGHPGSTGTTATPVGQAPHRPNIVFVLTDDLSTNLIKYMPHVQALQQAGMSFDNYFVTDSLCCPSRASIFTGDFPHNTKVVSNTSPDGGFSQFTRLHEDRNTFATSLSAAGYRTGFIGKYLNGYEPTHPIGYYAPVLGGAYVPPGWDMWNGVDSGGYRGFGYGMADNHDIRYYGDAPDSYFTTVAQQRSVDFLRQSAGSHEPFLLEIATFAPHLPSTPAPQDVGTFAGLPAPHTPAFGRKPTNPPLWLAKHAALGPGAYGAINSAFDKRVESVQAVDRMIGELQRTLVETGEASNTVFVFSSDNGFHLGDYTLRTGKQTAFDTDIRVPLIVSGPGIPRGSVSSAMVQNIDLRPTFDALAGTTTPAEVDGHSILPLLLGKHPPWRTTVGVEHANDAYKLSDPDRQSNFDGVPPTYNALRSDSFLYVRYIGGDREYYDLRTDPYELHNLGHFLSPARRAQLDQALHRLTTCHGSAQCWAAGLPRTA